MGVYAIRRLIWLPFLVIIVTFITFAMLRLGPGDPVQIWLGQHQNDQVRERIRAKLGLDDPLFIQYARYMEGVVTRLDFGESFKFRGKSVREVIGTRILVSMQLNLAAIIITLGIGIPVGLLAALRQGTGWDNLIVSIALAFQSLPVFITAPVMLLVFALHLDILPTSGWDGFFSPKIVMPAIVMGVPGIAIVVAAGARQRAGRAGAGIRPHRPSQGFARTHGALPAHSAQCPDSGNHQFRVHSGRPGRRHFHRGNLLRDTRRRAPVP